MFNGRTNNHFSTLMQHYSTQTAQKHVCISGRASKEIKHPNFGKFQVISHCLPFLLLFNSPSGDGQTNAPKPSSRRRLLSQPAPCQLHALAAAQGIPSSQAHRTQKGKNSLQECLKPSPLFIFKEDEQVQHVLLC
jgi:hypothetical protein